MTAGASPPPDGPDREDEEQLLQLRTLILGPLPEQVSEVEERLDDPGLRAADIAPCLADAVRMRPAPDEPLARALCPLVEEAVKTSARKRPRVLGDALYPVVGPAIRKSIAEAIRGMVQTLNRALEYSVTPRGLRWRVEAWKTGRSLGEVVLLHSLVYRVEQALLIHRETGLLLEQAVSESAPGQDPAMVSGMLTAIQDFAHDSFGTVEQDTLEALRVGDLTVWAEQGPKAVLAVVVRGQAPEELRTVVHDVVEEIHLHHSEELDAFDGDAAPFEATRPDLERCLLSQYQEETRRGNRSLLLLLVIPLIALIGLGGWWAWRSHEHRQRVAGYVAALEEEEGIVVTGVESRRGLTRIAGLRDPLAADPALLLEAAGLEPGDVETRWEPYHALEPGIALRRARQILQPPDGATLALQNGVLRVRGRAPHPWVDMLRRTGSSLPGIGRVDTVGLVDIDLESLAGARRGIEEIAIYFERGEDELIPGQREVLAHLEGEVRALLEIAGRLDEPARIRILGRTDLSGRLEGNILLSRRRADRIFSWLVSRGLDASHLEPMGVGTTFPLRGEETDADRAVNRSVSFQVLQPRDPSGTTGES